MTEPALDAKDYDGLLKIETTTSSEAAQTRNKKLSKDPILESINRRREFARLGQEKLDEIKVRKDGKLQRWVDVKDEVWPERESSDLQLQLKYPVYSELDWFQELGE